MYIYTWILFFFFFILNSIFIFMFKDSMVSIIEKSGRVISIKGSVFSLNF